MTIKFIDEHERTLNLYHDDSYSLDLIANIKDITTYDMIEIQYWIGGEAQ